MTETLEAPKLASADAGVVPASVPPNEAWPLACSGQATLVDLRKLDELTFVGQVPDKNRRLRPGRSGRRSALAQEAAKNATQKSALKATQKATQKAGFKAVSHISDAIDSELDGWRQRGFQDGGRHHGLPCVQG